MQTRTHKGLYDNKENICTLAHVVIWNNAVSTSPKTVIQVVKIAFLLIKLFMRAKTYICIFFPSGNQDLSFPPDDLLLYCHTPCWSHSKTGKPNFTKHCVFILSAIKIKRKWVAVRGGWKYAGHIGISTPKPSPCCPQGFTVNAPTPLLQGKFPLLGLISWLASLICLFASLIINMSASIIT